jgi:8-oxo-dGTP diphosphatase
MSDTHSSSADHSEARPIATVDAVVFVLTEDGLKVAVQRRDKEPFKGMAALPGGYIHVDKDRDAEAAVRRVLKSKCGMGGFHLEQLQTFSGTKRDPRGWSISVAYVALLPASEFNPTDPSVELVDASKPGNLAFDHKKILEAALTRMRGKGAYSTLPAALLGETFTLPQLRRAYEQVLDTKLDPSSFRRKVMELRMIEETGEMSEPTRESRRPSALYRLSEDTARTFDRSLG